MESSGQVTKTEEMMINDEGNDASRTCSGWDKRAGERRHISQYSGELLRERSSERSTPSGQTTPSWADIQSIRADTSSWEIEVQTEVRL